MRLDIEKLISLGEKTRLEEEKNVKWSNFLVALKEDILVIKAAPHVNAMQNILLNFINKLFQDKRKV